MLKKGKALSFSITEDKALGEVETIYDVDTKANTLGVRVGAGLGRYAVIMHPHITSKYISDLFLTSTSFAKSRTIPCVCQSVASQSVTLGYDFSNMV